MSTHNLPPLSALKALEAVAREGSISKAAESLHVSHSAISHQMRHLENWLDEPIIERHGPKINLTPSAERLASTVSNAFDDIRREVDLIALNKNSPVSISALPSVIQHWLLPKLDLFQMEYPNIPIHLMYRNNDKPEYHSDLRISFIHTEQKTKPVGWLFDGEIVAVCHKNYLRENGPFDKPEQLLKARLLQDEDGRMWQSWFAQSDIDYQNYAQEQLLFVEDSSLVINACLLSQGVGLCRKQLILEHLSKGELVELFPITIDKHTSYYINKRNNTNVNSERLYQWLIKQ